MDSVPYFPAAVGQPTPKLELDAETEHFLSNAPTVPELEPIPLELLLGAPAAPRRELHAWVLGAVAVCVAILVIATAR